MLIIDGHNLIPAVPGLSLGALDDEERLVEMLQLFARVRRKRIEVFFDGAPPGFAGERAYGMVRAHFVQAGRSADEAIRLYLEGLKKAARNATVVSSDRQVQAEARSLGASVVSAETFARGLLDLRAGLDHQAAKARSRRRGPAAPPAEDPPRDLQQWYDLFGIDAEQAEKPIPLSRRGRRGTKGAAPEHPPEGEQSAGQGKPGGKKPRKHHGFPRKRT